MALLSLGLSTCPPLVYFLAGKTLLLLLLLLQKNTPQALAFSQAGGQGRGELVSRRQVGAGRGPRGRGEGGGKPAVTQKPSLCISSPGVEEPVEEGMGRGASGGESGRANNVCAGCQQVGRGHLSGGGAACWISSCRQQESPGVIYRPELYLQEKKK